MSHLYIGELLQRIFHEALKINKIVFASISVLKRYSTKSFQNASTIFQFLNGFFRGSKKYSPYLLQGYRFASIILVGLFNALHVTSIFYKINTPLGLQNILQDVMLMLLQQDF